MPNINDWLTQIAQTYNTKVDSAKKRTFTQNPSIEARPEEPWFDWIVRQLTGVANPKYERADAPPTGPVDLLNAAEPLLHAGIPFLAARNGLPVFHGTSNVFEKFDPTKNDPRDTLGWMTHFAESPEYASRWAAGGMKGSGQEINMYSDQPVEWSEVLQPSSAFASAADAMRRLRPNVIPAKLDAQNAFDATNPSAMDVEAALAAVSPGRRQELIQVFKNMKKYYAEQPEEFSPGASATKYVGQSVLQDFKNPAVFNRTPFDAVRYEDGTEPAWAIPSPHQAITPWGAPLGDRYVPPPPVKEVPSENGWNSVQSVVAKPTKPTKYVPQIGHIVEVIFPGHPAPTQTGIYNQKDLETAHNWYLQGMPIKQAGTINPNLMTNKK